MKEIKEKIIKEEWHNDWKDSSLFECFDNAEKDIADWWIKKIAQEKQKWAEDIDIEKLDKQLRKRGFYITKMYKTENPNDGVEIGQEKEEQGNNN